MFNRLWAYLLIVICGINAIGVSGSAFLSEKSLEAKVLTVSSDVHDSDLSLVSHSDHASDDEQDDCGSQHKSCHQCHLGHCNFLIASALGFAAPDMVRSIQYFGAASYLSIELTGPKKPPRA